MKACAFRLGASALALAWCGVAAAQNTQPATSTESAAPASTAESERSDRPADESEIVVTAGRRSENLMRTAISASVLSGGDLAGRGVTNVDALQFATPSIVVNNF